MIFAGKACKYVLKQKKKVKFRDKVKIAIFYSLTDLFMYDIGLKLKPIM